MKPETLEEAAERYANHEIKDRGNANDKLICSIDFIEGAKWQAEQDQNKYSEEDLRKCWDASKRFERPISEGYAPNFNEFIAELKKG